MGVNVQEGSTNAILDLGVCVSHMVVVVGAKLGYFPVIIKISTCICEGNYTLYFPLISATFPYFHQHFLLQIRIQCFICVGFWWDSHGTMGFNKNWWWGNPKPPAIVQSFPQTSVYLGSVYITVIHLSALNGPPPRFLLKTSCNVVWLQNTKLTK